MSLSLDSRLETAFGEPARMSLAAVADDPRWGLAAPSDVECRLEAARPSREPILARRVGGRAVCVSPAERVCALRRAAQIGSAPEEWDVYVLEGMSDADADFVRRAAAHIANERPSDEWRQGLVDIKAELDSMGPLPWLKTGKWHVLATMSGTNLTLIGRAIKLQTEGVDGLRALVNGGRMTLRAAANVARLDPARQREIVAAVNADPSLDLDAVSKIAAGATRPRQDREPSASQIDADIRKLARAVAAGDASVDMEAAVKVQTSAAALLSVALAAQRRR